MTNEDRTVWSVFNGEIYNHRELRKHLESRGHVFKGRSDSEVLTHLYEEEGPGFVAKLRGMFALAIFDTRTRSLVLARDRFGIKPLFYALGSNVIAFASELRALLTLPDVDNRPDRQAVYDFAALFYIPAPETFYAGIRAILPGEMLEARLDGYAVSWRTLRYNNWSITPDPALTLDQATEKADDLLTTAVRQQLQSDVPLGALLSGGIDSSLVSASAQAALQDKLRTFNVRFSEREYDETWAARAVAEHIGSRHETLNMDGVAGNWNHVTGLLLHAGQPFADTSLFAVHAICRLMRGYVKVALSGDGGDEAFGGYDFYQQIATIAKWQRLPAPMWRGVATSLVPLTRIGIVPERLPQRLGELTGANDTAIVQNLLCWVREEEHRHLCVDSNVLPVRRLFEPQWENHLPPNATRLERLSALATEANIRLMLPNDFLFKVDTASMKESLEVRVPMLDEDIFAFGLSFSHRLKVNGRTSKRVLRRLAERKLPASVARKPKRGFGIPVDTWVDKEFKARLREVLLGSSSKLPEFFRPDVYRPLIQAFCDDCVFPRISRQGLYQRVIMLLAVQLALSSNGSQPLCTP